ncbi:hypothetical protein SATMO3_58030 [Sporomusa aerivorans]
MPEQKEMPGLREGQTLWRADEVEWNRRLNFSIVVDGEFCRKNFCTKYPNIVQLSDTSDLFEKVGAWNEVGRAAINAYQRLHEYLNEWLYDPSNIMDIDFMTAMLRDMKILSEYIEARLLHLKENRGY